MKKVPVVAINEETGEEVWYPSITKVADALGVNCSSISFAILQEYPCKGHRIIREDEMEREVD